MNASASSLPNDCPRVCLVGAGVVGSAIAAAHVDAGASFLFADQDETTLLRAVEGLNVNGDRWCVSPVHQLGEQLPAIQILTTSDRPHDDAAIIVIESIAERLDIKRDFFANAEPLFGENAILCSNTSTLRIGKLAEELSDPDRFCGMHFFMPVGERNAVEVIRGKHTSERTIELCEQHVRRIGKEPFAVGDGPGFIVNRLLSPYLNEAMLMLGRGVTAPRIEAAALAYGMPMSPLELMDWIGIRTTFDAGRVYWQSFPSRVDPAPLLPAMVKRRRLGRPVNAGFYDYQNGRRSEFISPVVQELSESYRRDEREFADDELMYILSISMWIEAAIAFRERVATSHRQFDLAMRGGLGFQSEGTWLDFFESIGSKKILETVERFETHCKSLHTPSELISHLRQADPTAAMDRFAEGSA